jgi:hypothetical protein
MVLRELWVLLPLAEAVELAVQVVRLVLQAQTELLVPLVFLVLVQARVLREQAGLRGLRVLQERMALQALQLLAEQVLLQEVRALQERQALQEQTVN